jgi:hypothetical protein
VSLQSGADPGTRKTMVASAGVWISLITSLGNMQV